jgi:hypothetical protein
MSFPVENAQQFNPDQIVSDMPLAPLSTTPTPMNDVTNPMDMMGQGGHNLATSAVDTAWNSQQDQRTPPTPTEEPGFFDKIGSGMSDFFGDEERMARMTIALNSMRLNPDPNIAKSMELRLERLSKGKGKNATVIKLREMGRNDLADAVESGAMKATDAWTLAFKPPSAFQEKLDFIKGKTDEEIKFYKESGILGGGTTVNLGDNKAYYDAVGKDIASMKKTWRGRGELARSSLTTYQALSAALQNFGPTGPGAETMQSLRELGARVGMPIDESKLGDGQYLQALKNRMVAEELRKNKGPQTDFDAEFAGTYIPGLGNTTEANRQILNYSKSISLQQTILADMAGSIRMTDPEEAALAIQRIDHLALMSPGAMERKDGTWITFSEFFSSDAKVLIEGVEQKLSSMSALERMTLWSDNYKKRKGFR